MIITLLVFGCGTYMPSCDSEASSVAWDEATSAGWTAVEVEDVVTGTWDEELVWEEGGSTELEVEVSGLADATWFDLEHTKQPWYQPSSFQILVYCDDYLEVTGQLALRSADGDLDETVDVVFTVNAPGSRDLHHIPGDAVGFDFRMLLEDWDSLAVIPDFEVEETVEEEYVSGDGWFSPTLGTTGELHYGVGIRGEYEDCEGRDCGYKVHSWVDIGAWGNEE